MDLANAMLFGPPTGNKPLARMVGNRTPGLAVTQSGVPVGPMEKKNILMAYASGLMVGFSIMSLVCVGIRD